jgi:hypothetical protein
VTDCEKKPTRSHKTDSIFLEILAVKIAFLKKAIEWKIPLEPVYSGKLFQAFYSGNLLSMIPLDERIGVMHCGGIFPDQE